MHNRRDKGNGHFNLWRQRILLASVLLRGHFVECLNTAVSPHTPKRKRKCVLQEMGAFLRPAEVRMQRFTAVVVVVVVGGGVAFLDTPPTTSCSPWSPLLRKHHPAWQ